MDKRSGLRITFDSGMNEFYLCPFILCKGKSWDLVYFYTHAGKLGWMFSRDIKYSEYGKLVAICPDCIKNEDTSD